MRVRKFNENIDDKPHLSMRTITTHLLECAVFDKFIGEVYGIHYNCLDSEDWQNYSTHVMEGIDGTVDMMDDDEIVNIKNGDDVCGVYRMLQILCDDGHIPSGNYMMFCDYE